MAAGLTIREEDLENVRRALNGDSGLSEDDFTERIMIDVALPFSYATREFVREMEVLEPFASGNARPMFAQKNVRVLGARALGRLHNVVKLKLQDEAGTIADAVMFTDADAWMDEMRGVQMMDVLYYPQINEYNEEVSVQLVVKDVRRSRSE